MDEEMNEHKKLQVWVDWVHAAAACEYQCACACELAFMLRGKHVLSGADDT